KAGAGAHPRVQSCCPAQKAAWFCWPSALHSPSSSPPVVPSWHSPLADRAGRPPRQGRLLFQRGPHGEQVDDRFVAEGTGKSRRQERHLPPRKLLAVAPTSP